MQSMEKAGAPAACWSCGQQMGEGQPFCTSCGEVQPPSHGDYFAVFGLPRNLEIDAPALEKQFYRYSRKLHPDLHARASTQVQEWSLAQASLLNDAYRTLKLPIERTRYLLELEGVQLEDSLSESKASKTPVDLLEEVFELNMQLEELRESKQSGGENPQLRSELEGAKQRFSTELLSLDHKVRSQWPVWDAAREQKNEVQKTTAKDAMASLLQRRRYLQNLVRDVDETLGAS